MITVPKAAHVDFALPYLREYLREHAITEGIKELGASLTADPLDLRETSAVSCPVAGAGHPQSGHPR